MENKLWRVVQIRDHCPDGDGEIELTERDTYLMGLKKTDCSQSKTTHPYASSRECGIIAIGCFGCAGRKGFFHQIDARGKK